MALELLNIGCFMILVLSLVPAGYGQENDVQPLDAVDVILNAFEDHQIVALSEMHAMREEHVFIQTLLRNEAFPNKINAVVMEGGNHLYQDILDKYIIHDEVPLTEVRIVWRNSSQSPNIIWDSEVFEQIYTTIHDVNKKLPLDKRIRVVAGGVPIDWSKIETADDMGRYRMSRDAFYSSVVQSEVLEKDRTALLIIGGMDILKSSNAPDHRSTVTQRLEAIRPGSVFVVWPHAGLLGSDMDRQYLSAEELAKRGRDTVTTQSLEKKLASWPVPSAALVKDTWLGRLELSLFLPGGFSLEGIYIPSERRYGEMTLSDGIDAYLYIGPMVSLTMSRAAPALIDDEAYLEELNRRSLLRFGRPFDRSTIMTKPAKYFPEDS